MDLRKTMQRKNFSKALLAAAAGSVFALGASSAFAQVDTANLAVKGTIVPAACSASFPSGDTVNYGTIAVASLAAGAYTQLADKTSELVIQCATDHTVTFTIEDPQSASRIADADMRTTLGTSWDTTFFGLGNATVGSTTVNLGSYVVRMSNTTVDGTAQRVLYANSTAPTTWVLGSANEYFVAGIRTFALGASVAAGPTKGKVYKIPLTIRAGLNKGSVLQVASETPLNGQAALTINYQ